ncbi:helix-turn-helix transcriptional regulator, partial [Roseibium denhamense]|uniref:helix-turn-helix domain-containing protein n=1 Tax=Roseibium denhamense TaxID=76305 RepID=UPI0031CF4518
MAHLGRALEVEVVGVELLFRASATHQAARAVRGGAERHVQGVRAAAERALEVVEMTEPGARRVPGLRREEVAQLAGVSVDYYVRLERGRHVNVSETVLDALARALRLDDTERSHLFDVARPTRRRSRPMPPQRVRPGLYRVLDLLSDT